MNQIIRHILILHKDNRSKYKILFIKVKNLSKPPCLFFSYKQTNLVNISAVCAHEFGFEKLSCKNICVIPFGSHAFLPFTSHYLNTSNYYRPLQLAESLLRVWAACLHTLIGRTNNTEMISSKHYSGTVDHKSAQDGTSHTSVFNQNLQENILLVICSLFLIFLAFGIDTNHSLNCRTLSQVVLVFVLQKSKQMTVTLPGCPTKSVSCSLFLKHTSLYLWFSESLILYSHIGISEEWDFLHPIKKRFSGMLSYSVLK